MDAKDGKIIVELATNPFASLESVGRTVELSGTSVRSRLDRLQAANVFQGIALVPPEQAFGRVACYCLYRDVADGSALAQTILDADDVVWCHLSHPATLAVMVYLTPDAPQEPPAHLRKILGREPDLCQIGTPSGNLSTVLSPLDWRILHPLLSSPRATVDDLASLTGLSVKTVRQRRRRMLEERLLVPHPLVDSSAEPGYLFFKLLVGIDARETINQVLRSVAGRARGPEAGFNQPPSMFLWGVAATFPEAHLIEFAVRQLPGVTRTDFAIPKGGAVATGRLQQWVASELQRWGRDVPGRPG